MESKRDTKGLLKALHYKEDSAVRQRAAQALGDIGDISAIDSLIEALRDEAWQVRWEATESLSKIGRPAVESLIELLKDENADVREKIHKEIERSLDIARTLGGDYQIDIQSGYPPAENHPEIVSLVKDVTSDLFDSQALADPQPEMGSEDFGYFASDIPGGMFILGCRIEDDVRRHHAPRFDIDEDCMPLGAAVLTETALRLMNQSKS